MTQPDKRRKLAQDIANGVAGWYQLQLSQGFGDFFGEDSAQLTILQILSAQTNFEVKPSQALAGHEDDQLRLDIALGAWGEKRTSYGAVEIKWLGSSNKASTAARGSILADALRLSVVESTNIKANFLVVGGLEEKFSGIFGDNTREIAKTEGSRALFVKLFTRTVDTKGIAERKEIVAHFPNFIEKLPKLARLREQDKLQVTLLASAKVAQHDNLKAGIVYVWLCLKGAGRKQKRVVTDPENSATSCSATDASASAKPSLRSAGSAP